MSSISNLLASINGGASGASSSKQSSSGLTSKPTDSKRPPASVSRNSSSATNRAAVSGASRPSDKLSRPLPSRPPNNTVPTRSAPSNGIQKLNSLSRPSPSATSLAAPGSNPKKGSFAEIMARAKIAQEKMGSIGMIQHKKVEATMTAKERKQQLEQAKTQNKKPRTGAMTVRSTAPKDRAASLGPKTVKEKKPVVPEKKARKPPPSTGYTGTARPSASSSKVKPGGALGINSALLNPPVHRPAARPSRYEEEEEDDMDDFIAGEDEEEEVSYSAGRRQYRYVDDYESDGSSDMEAGIDEIDREEARAQREAIAADKWEQEQERLRKIEKERRKRMLS